MNKPINKNNLNFFNLLKIISACIIAFFLHWDYHFIQFLGIDIKSSILSSRTFQFLFRGPIGYMSVELFFIISGFLFAYIYIPRIREKEYTFDKFIFKRVIRIMPLVILTSSVCYIQIFIMRINNIKCWSTFCINNINTISLIFDFIFSGIHVINNNLSLNGPIWYINVLLVCYILAYGISYIYVQFPNKILFMFPIILGIIIFETGWQFPFLTTSVARGYVAFFEGIILYFLINRVEKFGYQVKKMLIYISLFAFFVSFRYIFLHFENYSTLISNINIFFDFIIYPPLLYILYNFKWLNNFCNTRFIKYLGRISYGIYLWNFPILGGIYLLIRLFKLNNEVIVKYWFLIWIIMIILHFILSILSYKFIEKNFYYKKTTN
nr:acyltransferase [uncultured Leptotrichia sp.]